MDRVITETVGQKEVLLPITGPLIEAGGYRVMVARNNVPFVPVGIKLQCDEMELIAFALNRNIYETLLFDKNLHSIVGCGVARQDSELFVTVKNNGKEAIVPMAVIIGENR